MFFQHYKIPRTFKNKTTTGNQYFDDYVNLKQFYNSLHPFYMINPQDTVLVCGARGDLCKKGSSDPLIISTLAKHVVVIEAEHKNVKMLQSYIKEFDINNISIVNKIVWDQKTKLDFMCYPTSAASRVGASRTVKTNKIETITLNEIVDKFGKIGYAHLTINGAEYQALQGGDKLLEQKTEICIAFLGRSKELFESRKLAIKKLIQAGYYIGWCLPNNAETLKNWTPKTNPPFGLLYTTDTKLTTNPIEKWEVGQYGFAVATTNKNKLKKLGFQEK